MGYSLELVLAIESSDSNKLLGRHWRAKHEIFERIKDEIFLKTRNKLPEKPLDKFEISFIRYSAKTLDYDNYVASLKAYIDGARYAGIITDDSWEYIKHIPVDQVVSKERKLVVKIKEVT